MFDIAIIGAGSSGCALAARASEDPNRTVLLIEAGPDYADTLSTPYDLINSHNNSYTAHDWGLSYAPTQARSVRFPRGRVVGGSSAVNTAIALRGLPDDFEEWAGLGLDEWNWTGVLGAFKRLERDLDFGDRPFHGDSGPIHIRRYPRAEMSAPQVAFLEAARHLGYPECPDANDPFDWGVGPQPMNKLGRLRISCALGYLAPARLRPNLTIRAQTLATRLVVEGGRCVGAMLRTSDGGGELVRARLVVLAAGAILSPALMMRSGLGSRAHLEGHSIPVVRDIPGVGNNLSDHPALSVTLKPKDRSLIDFDAPIIQTVLRYTAEGSPKRNDLQIEALTFAGRTDEPCFGLAGVVQYQYGRGQVRLASPDPDVAPIIDNRFCEDPRDLERLVACMKDVLALAHAPPIADLAEAFVFPRKGAASDDELAALCRRFAASGYHPCGTVKMGPSSDPMAVVNQFGQCHGVDALVVADASIMPFVPRANTNLTAIMIGEKVGEWLRTRPSAYGL